MLQLATQATFEAWVMPFSNKATYDPNGQFAYLHDGESFSDNFVYAVRDESGAESAVGSTAIVRVGENHPPQLAPLADRVALVGTMLRITNTVTDPDVPANQFTFALGNGAPPTARILRNGVIIWRPTKCYALSTNEITVVVTDNGLPPMSDSATVRVAVAEFLQLSMGSTALRAGQAGSVAIEIETAVPVMHVQFKLNADLNRLGNFSLGNFSSAVQASSIQRTDPDHFLVALTLQPAAFPSGSVLAHLQFDAAGNQTSAFVPLRMSELVARESSGTEFPATLPVDGRVAFIANEPLLEATPQRILTLHGVPGSAYRIESTTNYSSWQTAAQGTLSGFSNTIDVPSSATIFYRVLQP